MMRLSEREREEVVKFRLEKARDTYAEISFQMEQKFYRTAANRLYYSCYYAITALLVNDGYETHTHNGVKTLLGLHYITKNKAVGGWRSIPRASSISKCNFSGERY